MVVSRIDKSITYPDIKVVDSDDQGLDATLYEVELEPGFDATIALGNPRFVFADKGVLYIPVYLIEGIRVGDQIGVYEFLSSAYPNLIDEDNDFDISKLDNHLPLFYAHVTSSYLKDKKKVAVVETERVDEEEADDDDDEEEEDEVVEVDADGEKLSATVPQTPTVLEQLLGKEDADDDEGEENVDTREEEMKERIGFDARAAKNWVQRFMKNRNYGIIDNEGSGHCLFAVIRDAYKGVKIDITVDELRQKLSDKVTDGVLKDFKEQYDMYSTIIPRSKSELIRISAEMKALERREALEKGRDAKLALVTHGKELLEEFRRVQREKEHAENLFKEFRFLEGIDTVEQLKAVIRTCKFWANAWAINTLERILNVKLVILSEENYDARDRDNVLQCGDFVDEDIKEKGEFKPRYYIVVSYDGSHYKLVTYKDRRIFRFHHIPYALKELIRLKCMEQGDGIYNYIPKFKRSSVKIRTDEGAEDVGISEEERSDEGLSRASKAKFDPTTVFQFYSKSRDKAPGKGAGETVKIENIMKFSELDGIPNWRRGLSNFSIHPFELDGHQWQSVEHYYHANKFKRGFPDFYLQFSLDSGSELSVDPAMAKAAGGKTGKYKGKQFRPKTVVIDEGFFSDGNNERVLLEGQYAKYSQNETAKSLLLATKDAKLQHFVRGKKPIVFYDTMIIRERLKG